MHPAWSIILFSTASGAGYGLLAAAGILAGLRTLPADRGLALLVLGTALGLITTGLLASTAHLGRPERAWRAVAEWRTSWLSREAVAALATYAASLAFALAWLTGRGGPILLAAAGILCALLAAATVVCTGMIYASLKPIARWRHPLVVPVYLALAAMTGLLWLLALGTALGHRWPALDQLTPAAVALAWALKEAYWRRTDRRPAPSTPETATGIMGLGQVRLLERPHTESSYLLREMVYRVARRHARRLRLACRLLAFALPLLLSLAYLATGSLTAALAAALLAAPGVLIERWLFFAQARHTVTLYYGASRA